MKRFLMKILLGTIFAFPMYASENNNGNNNVLIVYFSRTGTTEAVAKQIQQETNGDIFKIETVNPYPEEYRATTNQARRELNEGYLPPLKEKMQNLDNYDTIFLGYPNWWGTMPMAVFSFLKENDLNGKNIIPFVTHQGSRFGSSISDLTRAVPNGNVERNGLAIRGETSQREVSQWVKGVLK